MTTLFRPVLLACIAAFALSACGNKGDLVMPQTKPKPPASTPAAPAKDATQKPATSS
jgi:predicted small lipoprotein YifL